MKKVWDFQKIEETVRALDWQFTSVKHTSEAAFSIAKRTDIHLIRMDQSIDVLDSEVAELSLEVKRLSAEVNKLREIILEQSRSE